MAKHPFIRSFQPMPTPIPPSADLQRFQALYFARFGVHSKPECDALVEQMHLSPEQAIQLLEDLTVIIHHVFDAYFAAHTRVPTASAPSTASVDAP